MGLAKKESETSLLQMITYLSLKPVALPSFGEQPLKSGPVHRGGPGSQCKGRAFLTQARSTQLYLHLRVDLEAATSLGQKETWAS